MLEELLENDPFSNFRGMLQFIFEVSDYQTSGNMSVHVTIMTYYQAETLRLKKKTLTSQSIFDTFEKAVTLYLFSVF